jgi:ferric-dicitrate binding protein FerR (iron transport regulator)
MEYPINEHIINFLTRKESSEDVQKLKEWLAANPAHRIELKEWFATWDTAALVKGSSNIRPEEAYQRFMYRLEREASKETIKENLRHRKAIFTTIRRIAAIFVISFSSGILFHYYWVKNQPEQIAFIENIVPLGSKSEIKLPDGSTVWLNAGSTLRYATDYGRTTRDVYLIGEGYFKVAPKAENPFTVHTALMKVKALGTEFNVKAYPEEGRAETTLVNGKVTIDQTSESASVDKPVLLNPGQKFSVGKIFESDTEEITMIHPESAKHEIVEPQSIVKQLSPSTIDAEISWKERNWHIESEPLQNLTVKLERRYDVQIQIDDRLKNYRFTGTIKDESLEQVLHAMQLTAPILFKVNGKIVSIYTDPKKMK